MKNAVMIGVPLVLVAVFVGCSALGDVVLNRFVTVTLINQGDFDVRAVFYIHEQQEIPEALLIELGDEIDVSVAAGEVTAFARSCDDLQAIVLDDADLDVVGTTGPEANSDVLRDGDDFGCGDEIIFTFDHTDEILDFDVEVDVNSSS